MDAKDFRKHLRQNLTPAEARLWSLLRNKQVRNLKFRRQHTIGPYTVDFYCEEHRLVVELDGSAHDNVISANYDERRDLWLKAQGYKVLRFHNKELLRPDRVIWAIENVVDGVADE